MLAGNLARKINEVIKAQGQELIDESIAQQYIDVFYEKYPCIRDIFEEEWQKSKMLPQEKRIVESPVGRIRRFSQRANPSIERRFRVSLTQMIEADILKTTVVRLDRLFRRRRMQSRIVMLIFDAIWVEAPTNERQQALLLVEKMMKTAGRPFIEMKVDFPGS